MSKFEKDKDEVEGITWYFHKDMPEYIDTRSYIIPYIGVKGNDAWICIRYNYTGDDWVFWKTLKIVADGEKYTKSVGAFNTVRDNAYGAVWEWYDEVLNTNVALSSDELVMLKEIANSDKTIIRFEGDDYAEDLTVTSADKRMIKDALKLYGTFIK